MSLNYKDEPNGWSAGETSLSILHGDTMLNNYVPPSQHQPNPNFGAGNCDVGNNMMYFGSSLPMLPLHSNPYGGYSNNYCHPSASLHSIASQQQSLHTHSMAANGMSCLSSLNHAKSLNGLNSNYHAPPDSFCPLATSSGQYMPSMSSLARVSSMDGSEDNTDNSSNGSNSNNEMLMNNLNASMINSNHSYFYSANEVRTYVGTRNIVNLTRQSQSMMFFVYVVSLHYVYHVIRM